MREHDGRVREREQVAEGRFLSVRTSLLFLFRDSKMQENMRETKRREEREMGYHGGQGCASAAANGSMGGDPGRRPAKLARGEPIVGYEDEAGGAQGPLCTAARLWPAVGTCCGCSRVAGGGWQAPTWWRRGMTAGGLRLAAAWRCW